MGCIRLEIEITDFVEEFEALSKHLNHLLSGFSLSHSGAILAQECTKVHTVVVECRDKLALCQVLCLVDHECHDGLRDHIVHRFPHCVEVGDDEVFDDVGLKLGSRRALTRVIILSSHEGRHVRHVNLWLLLLPVFLDLVLVEVLEATFCLRSRVLLYILVLLYHISPKLVHGSGCLTHRLL